MRLVIGLLMVLGASPAAAGVACPENSVAAGCWPDAIQFSSNSPTGTMGDTGLVPWSAGTPCLAGCYDLPAGTLAARGVANTQGGCIAHVQVSDVYSIVGPAGPPLAFEAVLFVHAELAEGTSYQGSIESGGQSASCNTAPDCEAAIALSHAPGQSFPLSALLDAAGDTNVHPLGYAYVTGEIWFRGLPAGYSVVSCQNYDLPTPSQPTTWGGVKALYR